MMSFFQSSAGIFFTEWLLFSSLSAFVVCKLMVGWCNLKLVKERLLVALETKIRGNCFQMLRDFSA